MREVINTVGNGCTRCSSHCTLQTYRTRNSIEHHCVPRYLLCGSPIVLLNRSLKNLVLKASKNKMKYLRGRKTERREWLGG